MTRIRPALPLLALLAAACAAPASDDAPPASEASRDSAAAVADARAAAVTPPARASFTGTYTDARRGFRMELPDGVALDTLDGGERLWLHRGGTGIAEAAVLPYARAMERLREACVIDEAARAGSCPDPHDHEASHEERFTRSGAMYARFRKTWSLADGTGRTWTEEVGPFWMVEIDPGEQRVLLVRRPEIGLLSAAEVEAMEEIVRGVAVVEAS